MAVANLIFLSGPQAGERFDLTERRMTAGRSPSAEIALVEQTVSREQMVLELTADGWTLENLSSNRTRVDDKPYKTGRKVLLATGDVIGVGRETRILFVDLHDDPDEALAAYRAEHTEPVEQPAEAPPQAEAEPAGSEAPPPAQGEPEPEPQAAADRERRPTREQEEPEPGEPETPEAAERKRKLRMYAVGGVIYLLAMVGLIVFLATRGGETPTDGPGNGRLERLTRADVSQILDRRPEGGPNSTVAREALQEALRYYPDRNFRPGNLYRVVQAFKRHLAHKPAGQAGFEDPEHERMFVKAKRELVNKVHGTYDEAWKAEQAQNWQLAHRYFTDVQAMVPEPGNPIFENVVDHLQFVKRHLET